MSRNAIFISAKQQNKKNRDGYEEFLCITRTVEHKYILPSSIVRIQLHVSALYVGHLQVEN